MLKRLLLLSTATLLIAVLLSSCGGDDTSTNPPAQTGLRVAAVTQAPTIDGTIDGVWSNAQAFNVTVGHDATHNNAFGELIVMMKAVSYNNTLYVLAQWNDPSSTENIHKKRWGYDGQNWSKGSGDEDRFFMMFDAGDNGSEGADCATMCHQPTAGSMATTGGGHVDVWHWKAARTNPGSAADDKWWDAAGRGSDAKNESMYSDNLQVVGADEIPKYMHTNGIAYTGDFLFTDDTVAINEALDWSGKTIPFYYIDSTATGSRWEVKARGVYSSGTWTLEISRAFDTGHADDVVLGSGTTEVSVAITDNSGGSHSGSHPFNLIF